MTSWHMEDTTTIFMSDQTPFNVRRWRHKKCWVKKMTNLLKTKFKEYFLDCTGLLNRDYEEICVGKGSAKIGKCITFSSLLLYDNSIVPEYFFPGFCAWSKKGGKPTALKYREFETGLDFKSNFMKFDSKKLLHCGQLNPFLARSLLHSHFWISWYVFKPFRIYRK